MSDDAGAYGPLVTSSELPSSAAAGAR